MVVSMNPATRFTLAVLSTVSIVALTGRLVLADAAGDYETLFGAEAKKVAASGAKADDAAFAAKLLQSAGKMPDSPRLQILLYEKACEFGSAGSAGCDTALEALALLEKAIPARKAEWRRRKFEIVKFRFDKSVGAARKAAGKPYMEMLESLADTHVNERKADQAKALYDRAHMVAVYIKSSRASTILAKKKRADVIVAQAAGFKALQIRLKKNPQDTEAREKLIALFIVDLNRPEEAAKLLTDDVDELTRTYVPLAAKKPEDLNEAVCRELGDWYYKKLLKNASSLGRPVVLWRAKGYYERFVKLHKKKDASLFLVREALGSIDKERRKSVAPPKRVVPPKRVEPPKRVTLTPPKTLVLTLGKGVGMKFVLIGAGKFVMGSPKNESGHMGDEGPQRMVTISKPFYMGVTEVTQAQYQCIMNYNRSKFKGAHNPVESVTWSGATAFCTAVSKKTRRVVTLPTEAQWEYACRAGARMRFSFGTNDHSLATYGWCKVNSGAKTHPVGLKRPNAFGLYDMHGNVWEWCRDPYDETFYAKRQNYDPVSTAESKYRVVRGGSWESSPGVCRSANRFRGTYNLVSDNRGFRVVVVAGSGGK